MTLRDQFTEALMETGHARLENNPLTKALQEKYSLRKQRVIQMRVLDVGAGPWNFMLKEGRLEKLSPTATPDIVVTVSYLDVFLKLLRDEQFLEFMFAYDGCCTMHGRYQRVLTAQNATGQKLEISSDIILLRDVMQVYRQVLKEVLDQMLMKWPVRFVAAAASFLNPQEQGIMPEGDLR